jgi:hypothetical protein
VGLSVWQASRCTEFTFGDIGCDAGELDTLSMPLGLQWQKNDTVVYKVHSTLFGKTPMPPDKNTAMRSARQKVADPPTTTAHRDRV